MGENPIVSEHGIDPGAAALEPLEGVAVTGTDTYTDRATRFAELEGDQAELRAHRAELVAHLRRVLEACDKGTTFDEGEGIAAGLHVAIFELEAWPPVHGVE